ncbi:MAG: hypothetical protein J7L14_01215 [Candidatus Diapherotrites archaeon]|nr:hypothetical protein [Candidatus Diapherotrites archaeon]
MPIDVFAFPEEELKFAFMFPFTAVAKRIIESKNLSLENIPEEIIVEAKSFLMQALGMEKPDYEIPNIRELLINKILAFPLSKVFVGLLQSPRAKTDFSNFIEVRTFNYLRRLKDPIKLANALDIDFELNDINSYKVPLETFLKAPNELVNQTLVNGFVILSENGFNRFLARYSAKIVAETLTDLQRENFPKRIVAVADEIRKELFKPVKFDKLEFNVNLLPSCIKTIMQQLLSGENVSHAARFQFAVFMAAIGLPQEKIIEFYKKTPNYSEKMTRYQVERIISRKYSPASCEKMKLYNLCNNECKVKNPIQFYRRELNALRRQRNKTK